VAELRAAVRAAEVEAAAQQARLEDLADANARLLDAEARASGLLRSLGEAQRELSQLRAVAAGAGDAAAAVAASRHAADAAEAALRCAQLELAQASLAAQRREAALRDELASERRAARRALAQAAVHEQRAKAAVAAALCPGLPAGAAQLRQSAAGCLRPAHIDTGSPAGSGISAADPPVSAKLGGASRRAALLAANGSTAPVVTRQIPAAVVKKRGAQAEAPVSRSGSCDGDASSDAPIRSVAELAGCAHALLAALANGGCDGACQQSPT
jgi:hypothetical protein